MKTAGLSLVAVALIISTSCGGAKSPAQPTIPTLASFTSGTWSLKVDRTWDGTGGPQTPAGIINDAAYRAVSNGPTYRVMVSNGGLQVTIDGTVRAARDTTLERAVQYNIVEGAFAGGRFVIWPTSASGGLQAEFTIYGSGVPIVKSERGTLQPAS